MAGMAGIWGGRDGGDGVDSGYGIWYGNVLFYIIE